MRNSEARDTLAMHLAAPRLDELHDDETYPLPDIALTKAGTIKEPPSLGYRAYVNHWMLDRIGAAIFTDPDVAVLCGKSMPITY